MITLETAIKMAKEVNEEIDTYQEYADAYEFYISSDEAAEGGAGRSCIIDKSAGNKLHFAEYFLNPKRNVVEIGEPKQI